MNVLIPNAKRLATPRIASRSVSRGGIELLRCWSSWWLWCAHWSGNSSRSGGAAAARSWSGTAGASRSLAARSTAAAWCCTAWSCTRRLSTARSTNLLALWSLAATSSLCIASDQNHCQQGCDREHHLANHNKSPQSASEFPVNCGMAPRRPEIPDSVLLD